MEVEKILRNSEKLGKNRSSTKVLFQALNILKINKKNIVRRAGFGVIELAIAIVLAKIPDTIPKTESALSTINTVLLAFFAVVFTGYAFFQALINDTLLMFMINEDAEKKTENSSKLEESNYYFAEVMMLQFVVIMINMLLILTLGILPMEWCLFDNQIVNETLCIVGIFGMLYINTESLWETKSFIFNVFQLFNAHAMSRIISILKKKKDN